MQSAIGLVGLAVMGQNLALNIADNHFTISVYNRTAETTKAFIQQQPHRHIYGYYSYPELIASLSKPRIVLLMVKAGQAVDDCLRELLPLLDAGDIIIDGGNSHFDDTQRRYQALQQQQIRYLGMGISGGEQGARIGPSIMPGGDKSAWPVIAPIFRKIAAQVDNTPCCDWIGDGAAGHCVKMVHNGIEYGDMQLISEAYAILRFAAGLNPEQLQGVFAQWNEGVLQSYLIEITADILSVYDNDGRLLLDNILDSASQKGTGKWTVNSALDESFALTLISEAVFARLLSAEKNLRQQAAQYFPRTEKLSTSEQQMIIQQVHDALYAAKIISYTQGFMLLQKKAASSQWQFDFASIARLWRGGCIIRSRFLNNIADAFDHDANLSCLLFADFFKQAIEHSEDNWRQAVILATQHKIPAPAMNSALAFFDGLTSENSAANMLQAQRDYFGAHTYQRVDRPLSESFHSDWIALAKAQGKNHG